MFDVCFGEINGSEQQADPLARFPKVEALVEDIRAAALQEFNNVATTDSIIASIKREYDQIGPYWFAKKHNLLVNESGEEFAIEWMTCYNSIVPGTY